MSETTKHAAALAAALMAEANEIQNAYTSHEWRLRVAAGESPSYHPETVAADALALIRIGAGVARWAEKACNGIVRYQGNGISCGTWHESDEAAKDKADARALAKAQAIADRYGATVAIGGDPRGYVLRLHLAGGRSNGMAGDGWGVA